MSVQNRLRAVQDWVSRRPIRVIVSSATQSRTTRVPTHIPLHKPPEFPSISALNKGNVCSQRRARRSVLFSLQRAGRPWGRGGPSMKRAKRTPDSSLTCRR